MKDDTISRQDALQVASEECQEFRGIYGRIEDRINQLPSAEPEIIRCRDCKYASSNGVYGCILERFSAHDESTRLFANDYCSAAERRTDDGE